MSFKSDERYNATVYSATMIESKISDAAGIKIVFDTDEGLTECTLWLTERNREHVFKSLKALGVDQKTFDPQEDLDELIGAECSVVVDEEEYRGTKRFRVKWINAPRSSTAPSAMSKAAKFFGVADKSKRQVSRIPSPDFDFPDEDVAM